MILVSNEENFKIPLSDYYSIDISLDVHVKFFHDIIKIELLKC
ncbi:MAG: hypothetical protein ACI4XR_04690 [Bacilli bacterium]